MKEFIRQPEDWRNYMRMIESTYVELLEMVKPFIIREDTYMRKSISPHKRLSATLRCLATGRCIKDLNYSVRIEVSTLSEIIPETCKVIFNVLQTHFLKIRNI